MVSDPRALPDRTPDSPIGSSAKTVRQTFPSGRSLDLTIGRDAECIEVRSASGDLELSITLTEAGPVFRMRGAKFEIDSTDSIALRCRRFELATEESLELHAGGAIALRSADEIRVRSAQQTYIDGDYVNLNCLDRTGYHDEVPPGATDEPPADASPSAP